jgi:hypothetical protein
MFAGDSLPNALPKIVDTTNGGNTIPVTFGWIRNNDGVVRLVTGIPTKQ